MRLASSLIGPTLPGSSGSMPGRAFFSMARACSGMSGRLQASGAGERSSVLVSPVTLKMVTVRLAGTSGREVNHSASAQERRTALALALPLSARALTSSKIVEHQQGLLQAPRRRWRPPPRSSSSSISGLMLNPPSMVPSSSVALDLGISGHWLLALGHLGQEFGLDLGGVVHAGRNPVGEQVEEGCPRPRAGFCTSPTRLRSGRRPGAGGGCRGRPVRRRVGGIRQACSLPRKDLELKITPKYPGRGAGSPGPAGENP